MCDFHHMRHCFFQGIILYKTQSSIKAYTCSLWQEKTFSKVKDHSTDGYMHPSFTLEEAFGREENDYEDGMSVTELLDSTNAKLVYFPSYACTSFFVRDTMNHISMTNANWCR